MSGMTHHTDLHPGRNTYSTSHFILSVLFMTGGETSVVPTRVPCYMDLHPGRNVYLTSWFILSVLFFTGGETSVVIRCVWDLPSHDLHPGRNISLTRWFILSVLFLTGGETSVVPTHFRDPLSHAPPLQ